MEPETAWTCSTQRPDLHMSCHVGLSFPRNGRGGQCPPGPHGGGRGPPLSVRLPSELVSSSSYNPFDGPNENPEAELPLTAGKYLYVYGDMDEDGFYEGLLERGRRAGGRHTRPVHPAD